VFALFLQADFEAIRREGRMDEQSAGQDRRGIGRFNLKLRSLIQELRERERILELYTRDVSSDGAFFLTDDPPPVDTNLSLTLFLPAGPTPKGKINVDGKVIRTEQNGMAVRFNPNYTLVAV
jgi:hypothetical protein